MTETSPVTEPATLQRLGQPGSGVFFVLPMIFADFASASRTLIATTVAKPRRARSAATAIAARLLVVAVTSIFARNTPITARLRSGGESLV